MLYGLPGINNHIHNERSNSEALFHYDSKQNGQVTLGFHIIVPVDSFAQICPRYLKMCSKVIIMMTMMMIIIIMMMMTMMIIMMMMMKKDLCTNGQKMDSNKDICFL